MDVGDWLRSLGLERYEQAFRDNEIDVDLLPNLTGDDLKDLGVALVGHRRRLLDAIAALRERGRRRRTGCSALPRMQREPGLHPARLRPEAERRQLTVMFVDLVGSTALSARLDPEEMREVLRAYQNAVAGEIARFEGHVAKFMGDGVLAYFGWPRAHEDEAERAVRAGLAIVAAVARLSGGGQALACRVGIATGLVVVGDLVGEGAAQEEAVVGDTPNLAARLQAVAEPGAVVIGERTRQLVGDLFELRSPGAADASRACAEPVPALRGAGRAGAGEPVRGAPDGRRWRRSSAATRSWRCCSSAGARPRAVRGSWSCSPARPGSASRGSPRP